MANLAKLEEAVNELETQSRVLKQFNRVYSDLSKLRTDIAASLVQMTKSNSNFSAIDGEIRANLVKFQKQLEKIERDLLRKIQELHRDNKAFQRELDSSLSSRLERYKSDIQVEIRNEGVQIQRAFENSLTSKFHGLEAVLKEQFGEQKKQFKALKLLLAIVLAMSIGILCHQHTA